MAVDHRRQPLQATRNRWVRLFSLLTKPSARLTDAADRRQAEILAVLQLFLVPIGIVVVSVRVVLQPDFIFVYLFVVATSVIGVVAYGLSRTHWARWGAWLQVALTGSTLFVAVFINPLDHTVYWYMALPVLFASVLLSVKECAVVSAAVLVGLGLLWLLWPPAAAVLEWMQVGLLVLCSLAVLVSGHWRNLLERDRQKSLLKRQSQQLSLLDSAFDGTAFVDNGKLIEVSDGFAELFGDEPKSLVGADLLELFEHGQDNAQMERAILLGQRVLLGVRRGRRAIELAVGARDVETHQASLVAVRDVTSEEDMENRLRHVHRLTAAGHLAAGIAHEINNPLAVIMLRLDLIRRYQGGGAGESHFDVIDTHIERIRHVVNYLRSFSRPHLHTYKTCRLLDLVLAAQRLNGDSMAGIEVDLSGIPDASTVYGQPFQLEEVFSNLFQFAQRSMGGEGKIQISAMEEGDVVSIRFRDSKSGLDPDGFEQLFSPVGMGSEAFGRVGMELPISWGIIQEHQSVLRVKNVDGGGMEFSFSLAKSPAIPPSGSPTRSESPAQQVDGAFELRVLCVLCVEDELHLLELIEAYLGNMGCKVIPARTRHEALQALDSQAIAGVISDLSLADGSGVELLQEIVEKCPHLEGKMLLISGSSSALQGTNYPVLNKPFRMQRLWEIVQAWESRDPSVQ